MSQRGAHIGDPALPAIIHLDEPITAQTTVVDHDSPLRDDLHLLAAGRAERLRGLGAGASPVAPRPRGQAAGSTVSREKPSRRAARLCMPPSPGSASITPTSTTWTSAKPKGGQAVGGGEEVLRPVLQAGADRSHSLVAVKRRREIRAKLPSVVPGAGTALPKEAASRTATPASSSVSPSKAARAASKSIEASFD